MDGANGRDPGLCTYAAISNAPTINAETKIVRLNINEKTAQIRLTNKPANLYIQYPMNQNFALNLRGFTAHGVNGDRAYIHCIKYLDDTSDTSFNPTKLV